MRRITHHSVKPRELAPCKRRLLWYQRARPYPTLDKAYSIFTPHYSTFKAFPQHIYRMSRKDGCNIFLSSSLLPEDAVFTGFRPLYGVCKGLTSDYCSVFSNCSVQAEPVLSEGSAELHRVRRRKAAPPRRHC